MDLAVADAEHVNIRLSALAFRLRDLRPNFGEARWTQSHTEQLHQVLIAATFVATFADI